MYIEFVGSGGGEIGAIIHVIAIVVVATCVSGDSVSARWLIDGCSCSSSRS